MIFFVKTPYLKSGLGPFMLCLKEYDFFIRCILLHINSYQIMISTK